MKAWLQIARGVAAAASLAVAQQHMESPVPVAPSGPARENGAPLTSGPRIFRVHVADGRDGSPVAGVHLRIWYDEASGQGYGVATGAQGDAAMPKPVSDPLRVLVSIGNYTDCRKPGQAAPPDAYNLALIAETGVSVENGCGPVAVRTGPGELVLYVRPSRWYEKLNRNPS